MTKNSGNSGGVMVITDLEEHPYEWFHQEMADRWLGFQPKQVREWLLSAGLKGVEVGCAGCNCRCRPASGKVISVAIFYARGRK